MAIIKNGRMLEVNFSSKLKELLKPDQGQLIKNKNIIIEDEFNPAFMIRTCPRCSLEMIHEAEYFKCPHCKLIKIPKHLVLKIDEFYQMKEFLRDKILLYRKLALHDINPGSQRIYSDLIKKLQEELAKHD